MSHSVLVQDDASCMAAVHELNRRQQEALRLYRPMPTQLPFHLSLASERIVRGGNRSGKTACASAEFSSAACKIPLTDLDGNEMPFQYPADEPLTMWIIGYDEPHIARVYRKLFMPGLFRIINDPKTGKMRAWMPWNEEDKSREAETKPAPPLIPPRMVKEWAWENKAEQVFSVCRLHNGTTIYAMPSGGAAGQGDSVHVIWIDEDIKFSSHVQEWQARLSDVKGRLIWSVWPHTTNNALMNMSKRAKQQRDREKPDVFEVVLKFRENPYIDEDEKRKRIEGWNAIDSSVTKSRDEGEFAIDNVLVFPSYHADVHCIPSAFQNLDRMETFLAASNYQVPLDWTNYFVLDPGHTQPAGIFAAVPPPWDFGEHILIWDEVYIPRLTPDELAGMVRERAQCRVFEDFIIDFRAGRQTQVIGKTIRASYEEAFERAGLRSIRSGSSFHYGSDNIEARNMEVRRLLAPGPDGTPRIRFLRDKTPAIQTEFSLYKKRVTRDDNVREEVVDENNHAMDAIGYLAAYGPQYVMPDPQSRPLHPMVAAWKKLERNNRTESQTVWMGAGARQESAGMLV